MSTDKRSAPARKVVRSELMRGWKPYRRDVLECGHVVDFLPVTETKIRRCEYCHAKEKGTDDNGTDDSGATP